MPANAPDFEKYAQTLQQTMAEAIAEAESLAALAAADREAAADLRVSMQAKLNELENRGHQTASTYVTEHRRELQEKIREEVLTMVATKLLNSGQSVAAIAALLDVSEDFVELAGNRRKG